MAKSRLNVIIYMALFMAVASYARNIPSGENALSPVQNMVEATASSPEAGLKDEKNFITYGGVGGWAGIGGYSGVIPVLGGVGGLGGIGGAGGGLGAAGGGLGGLGGIGGGVGSAGGAGGVGGIVP